MRHLTLVFLIACGGSRTATHDAPDNASPDALVPVPTYGAAPDQVLLPPATHGTRYGREAAISADGLTLATFDEGALYAFTRATTGVPFPDAPNITIQPAGLSAIGFGLSVSADGSLIASSAVTTGNQLELLVFERQGPTYGMSPQQIPVQAASLGVLMTAMSTDAGELAYNDANDGVSILPRSGSTFSSTPSLLIPKPASASTLFASTGSLSASGSTIAIGDPQENGVGTVYVYTGGTAPAQTLPPTTGASFGNAVALRSDGVELVEGSIFNGGEVGVYQRGSSGYTRVQTLPPPASAGNDYALSVSLAGDGTLVVTDAGSHIYIFAAR